jgi:hypothetical protein
VSPVAGPLDDHASDAQQGVIVALQWIVDPSLRVGAVLFLIWKKTSKRAARISECLAD